MPATKLKDVRLREKIILARQVVVAAPGIVLSCLFRHLRESIDYSLKCVLLLAAVR